MSEKPRVAVVMGSISDEEYMEIAIEELSKREIETKKFVLSAHRNPDETREFAVSAKSQGFELIIAGAGHSAHLPGFIASLTDLPVIGVPLPTSSLLGIDSLLSMVQMPGGVPVATMGIGKAGAKNAAIFAVRILKR